MGRLTKSIWRVAFPIRESNGVGRTSFSVRYISLLLVFPLILGGLSVWFAVELTQPAIVASSVGVLGGLLIAHAIFVFQLRVSLKPIGHPDAIKDERVYSLVDEMFDGVLWSSVVALVLTLATGALAAVSDVGVSVDRFTTGVFVIIAAHLVGCLIHVITATTSAYSVLKDSP